MGRRGNPHKHKYKYGKLEKSINLDKLQILLDRVDHVDRARYSADFIKALMSLLYWTGFRIREIIGVKPHSIRWRVKSGEVRYAEAYKGILKKDMWVKEGFVFVRAKAFKHGKRVGPVAIPEKLLGMNYLIERWNQTREGSKLFPISHLCFWRILKRVDKKLYPHFFRFNRITKFCDDPKASIAKISSWTGVRPETVSEYLERSGRFSKELGQMMSSED